MPFFPTNTSTKRNPDIPEYETYTPEQWDQIFSGAGIPSGGGGGDGGDGGNTTEETSYYPGTPSGNWWEDWNITDPSGRKQIIDAYYWIHGRAPSEEELNSLGPNPTEAQIREYLRSIGEGPGDGGIEIPEGAFPYSKSYGGLPPWANDLIKKYMEQYMEPYAQSLQESLNEIANAPGLIEQTRQAMVNQYLDTNLRPAISNLSSRGVLSSSTAEGTLGKVGEEAQNRADIWAGNALLANLDKKAEAYQKQMALMNQLLELAKYSESEGANPLAPWELILKYLIQD